MPTFTIEVDGIVHNQTCETGDYAMAAVAALAELGMERPRQVKIWSDEVMPDYGPYWYRVGSNKFGDLVVETISRKS